MNLKQWLKLKFTDKPLEEDVIYYCQKCKKKTIHTEHGFRGSNYRISCSCCNGISLYEGF